MAAGSAAGWAEVARAASEEGGAARVAADQVEWAAAVPLQAEAMAVLAPSAAAAG